MVEDPPLASPLAVVCHDAGAANVILPWLDRAGPQPQPLMQGPAERLWRQRFPHRALAASLETALDGAAMLLSGTGWASDLEHDARAEARRRGLRSVALIDHWVNYAERFERRGQVVWPDEFWVTDDDALAIARACFPGATIRRFDNRYLAEQSAALPPAPSAGDVLLVMEPMRSDWGRGVAGEFQALDWFVERRASAGIPPRAPSRLRPHPSDPTGKYSDWLERHPGTALDTSQSLAEAMTGARWVAGCESYALVVALAAGREVISTLPPWAPPCRLPHRGIRRLASC